MTREPLPFPVRLWIRHHEDGSVTVAVLGESRLILWGPRAEPVIEELELALSDRIERSHPRLLERFAQSPQSEVISVEVPDALIVFGEGEPERIPTALSVVVTQRGSWQELWIPRLEARLWLSADADVVASTIELASELIADWPAHQRIALRRTGEEALETLEVRVAPADLTLFTGPDGAGDMLPEPAPSEAPARTERPDGKLPPPTPTLDAIGQPLHELARAGRLPRAFERDEDVQRLLDLLASRAGPVVLVGPRGVGKGAVLNELAHRLAADDAPTALLGRPAFFVDAGRLIAGSGFFGEWQRQVLDVIQEVVSAEVTWFLGELLPLLDAGKSIESNQNVAQMLKPALSTGEVRVVAECSDADWAQLELRNPGFARLFTPLRLTEPPLEITRTIVARVSDALSDQVRLDAGARRAVVDLARRYGGQISLVGASVQLLRRLADGQVARAHAAWVAAERPGPPPPAPIDRFDVVRHVCEETGLPEFLVRDDLPLDREQLAERFRRRILGQEPVVAQMSDLVARIKAGVSDASRPLGAYLFIGPTGVGKTETVKVLASLLYGREDRVLRFDMSEFAGPDCVDRLLGADASSGLVARVGQVPFAVVLLDEIEKAHPAVFDLLLQILGEARLSDRQGRLADFRNTIVLMTSNLGVDTFRRPSGFGTSVRAALAEHLLGEVHRFFRPELVGRLDEIVVFEPLGPQPIAQITHRELDKITRREGLMGRDIGLSLEAGVPGWLAERGVDLRYGARPLKRTLERRMVAPIGRALSRRSSPPRSVHVSVGAGALRIRSSEEVSDAVARDASLSQPLAVLGRLRWLIGRWESVEGFRAARHTVRLVDRLSSTQAFWRDEAAARRRLATTEGPRALTEAHGALLDRVEALEDLILEAWAGLVPTFDDEVRSELLAEVDAAVAAMAELEWRIAGLRHAVTDQVTLWFLSPGDSQHHVRTMEPLILAYVRLALRHGWTLRVALRRRGQWKAAHEDELDEEQAVLEVLRSGDAAVPGLRLQIAGRHSATVLLGEAGVHGLDLRWTLHDVELHTRAGRAIAPDPKAWTGKRRRNVEIARDRIRDLVVHRQRGVGRLSETLLQLIREEMLISLFGRERAAEML